MKKIELFLATGEKIGEFISLDQIKAIQNNIPTDIELTPIKLELQTQLTTLQNQRLQNICKQYGYVDLADIERNSLKEQNGEEEGTEATDLSKWWDTYDDLIWNYIDNELSNITDLDELLTLDIRSIEKQIYENSVKSAPLP